MTKGLLGPEMRFKLDMIAAKYNVPSRGMTVGQIVAGIARVTNELTAEERATLERICRIFGMSLRDLERGK